MKLQPAQRVATQIIQALHPHCIEIEVAGSIRRQMPDVKDVEIVYISKTSSQQMDLFGSHFQTLFHVDNVLATLINNGILIKDTTVPRWGPKYKRAIHCATGIVIELFRAEPNNWGYILALRTGSEDFNKLMVTKRAHGGALPSHLTLKGGYVWDNQPLIPTIIPTPTETIFFRLLRLPFIPPQERTVKRLRQHIEERQNR